MVSIIQLNFNCLKLIKGFFHKKSFKSINFNFYDIIKKFHFSSVTPLDYEPPGFKSSDFEAFKFDNGERCFFECGNVDQRWLQMNVNVNIAGSMFKNQTDVTTINDTFTEDLSTMSINYERPKKRMKPKKKPEGMEKPLGYESKPNSPKQSNSKEKNHSGFKFVLKHFKITRFILFFLMQLDVSELADTDMEMKETSDEEAIFSPSLLVRHIKCDCQLQDV